MERVWRAYALAGVALAAVYVALPAGPWRQAAYLVVAASVVPALVVGIRRYRPARAAAWRWMAVGLGCFVGGDIVFVTYQEVLDLDPYPSLADALYLAAYPLIAAGMVLMIRVRRRGIDVAGLVDSTIVAVGLGLLSWVVLAGPVARAVDETVLARVVGVAYPAADVLLLALVVRLLIGAGARNTSFRLLVAGASTLLVADTLFALSEAGELVDGGAGDLAYMTTYVLWGASALHPSMGALTVAGQRRGATFTRRRLAGLTVAVLIAPATLAVQLTLGATPDAWAVVIASVLLFGLVVARMNAAIAQVTASRAQRDRLQDDLAHQAAHDPLTSLANRARALELTGAALARARRSGAVVGLLFIDLDHFKAVNDSFGHRAGDDVLRETAARMLALVRATDVVGRLGGDEFVVLVEAPASEAALVELAERLVAAVAAPVTTGGRRVAVGASIGVAVARDGDADAVALLHDADVAAYRAKASGRARVEVFDDALRRELEERAGLEAAIRAGLERGEFLLHYQPVVTVTAAEGVGVVEGYEALVRWDRPGHGLVPPDAFIPTAERSTLVCDLGRWVLGEATRQLAAWTAAAPPGSPRTTVAVNISGRHLASPDVVRDVAAALDASGLDADRLVLEITETVLVEQPVAAAHLGGLRALGVGVSIDDFGTGYTSIGQLQHLHADTIKIDRSLVASTSPGAQELVRLVVHAAHAFGLNVVAEGVEHEHQLSPLLLAGCDSAQGYLFARPQPAAAISPFVERSALGAAEPVPSA